jgi:hypothetical protein
MAVLSAASLAAGAVESCADCHLANPELDSYQHVLDWQSSPHGRAEVGCERCHGGDASSFRKFLAHRGMFSIGDDTGPLHRNNLPQTCGNCHAATYRAFESTEHATATSRDAGAPSCVSCHGTLAAQQIGPNGIRVSCSRCHGADGKWPDAGTTALAPESLRQLREIRGDLKRVRNKIRKVSDGARRHELEAAQIAIETWIEEALEMGHAMDLRGMSEQLGEAQRELVALSGALAKR